MKPTLVFAMMAAEHTSAAIAAERRNAMQTDLSRLVVQAKTNDLLREQLIHDHERTILRTASLTSRRFVSKSDDEWSVALCAFSRAIDTYEDGRGDFLPYAKTLIRRDLIDHFRREVRHSPEIATAPEVLAGTAAEDEDNRQVSYAVERASVQAADNGLAEEITAVNEMLAAYGFSFFDLTACSPRQEKTRRQCADAVRWLLRHPDSLRQMKNAKRLPLSALRDGVPLPEKLLDRYRRYIIAAALILSEDYPHIAEYLKFIGKEVSA